VGRIGLGARRVSLVPCSSATATTNACARSAWASSVFGRTASIVVRMGRFAGV